MRTASILAVATALLIVANPGLASADDQQSAQEVIDKLKSEGYTVRIDRIGTAPIEECVVTSVRNPQEFTQLVPLLGTAPDEQNILVPVVISKPISVSLDCTGR